MYISLLFGNGGVALMVEMNKCFVVLLQFPETNTIIEKFLVLLSQAKYRFPANFHHLKRQKCDYLKTDLT